MPRGGYRPGTGRPKGAKDSKPRKGTGKEKKAPVKTEREQIKEILALGHKAKAKMYQEYLLRISKGDKLSIMEKKLMDKLGADLEYEIKQAEKPDIESKNLNADVFLRQVWNDPTIEISLRIRAAEIIFRADGEKKGKKSEKEKKAKQAGVGKFAPGKAPLKLVK